MTQPVKRLLRGAVAHAHAVLADLRWLAGTALVLGLVLAVLPVLVVAGLWLVVAIVWVMFAVLPKVLVLPAFYLSAWMPTWMALIITVPLWLAVADEALRLVDVAGRARIRRLAASLAACVEVGAAPPPKLKARVERTVQRRMSTATHDFRLDEAARWLSAEDALHTGDYQVVAAALAQAAEPAPAGATSAAAQLRRGLRLAAVGMIALVLVGALGATSVVDTCLSCGPHQTQEHRLWR
jgi:hypothetical protein